MILVFLILTNMFAVDPSKCPHMWILQFIALISMASRARFIFGFKNALVSVITTSESINFSTLCILEAMKAEKTLGSHLGNGVDTETIRSSNDEHFPQYSPNAD